MKKVFMCMFLITLGCASTPHRFGNELPEQNRMKSRYTDIVVKISAVNPLDTSVSQTAQNAIFVVSENTLDRYGTVIIRKNESVTAAVTISACSGGGYPGKISIDFQKTRDVLGKEIYFNSTPVELEGESRRGMSVGLTVGMFFVYCPFNFLHLVQTGYDVSIPAGYIFQARVL